MRSILVEFAKPPRSMMDDRYVSLSLTASPKTPLVPVLTVQSRAQFRRSSSRCAVRRRVRRRWIRRPGWLRPPWRSGRIRRAARLRPSSSPERLPPHDLGPARGHHVAGASFPLSFYAPRRRDAVSDGSDAAGSVREELESRTADRARRCSSRRRTGGVRAWRRPRWASSLRLVEGRRRGAPSWIGRPRSPRARRRLKDSSVSCARFGQDVVHVLSSSRSSWLSSLGASGAQASSSWDQVADRRRARSAFHRRSRTLAASAATSALRTSTAVTRPSGASLPPPLAVPRRVRAPLTHIRSCPRSFIEYSSRYDAEEAIRKLDGTDLNGVAVAVKDEVRSRSPSTSTSLAVADVPPPLARSPAVPRAVATPPLAATRATRAVAATATTSATRAAVRRRPAAARLRLAARAARHPAAARRRPRPSSASASASASVSARRSATGAAAAARAGTATRCEEQLREEEGRGGTEQKRARLCGRGAIAVQFEPCVSVLSEQAARSRASSRLPRASARSRATRAAGFAPLARHVRPAAPTRQWAQGPPRGR